MPAICMYVNEKKRRSLLTYNGSGRLHHLPRDLIYQRGVVVDTSLCSLFSLLFHLLFCLLPFALLLRCSAFCLLLFAFCLLHFLLALCRALAALTALCMCLVRIRYLCSLAGWALIVMYFCGVYVCILYISHRSSRERGNKQALRTSCRIVCHM